MSETEKSVASSSEVKEETTKEAETNASSWEIVYRYFGNGAM